MKTLPLTIAAGTVAAALALTGCGGGSADEAADGLTTVKVAYTPIYTVGALQLGIDQGFFEAEGLELELSQVANPPAGLAAVAGGQVDFNYSPSIPVVNAVAGGVKIKVAAAADGYADGTAQAVSTDAARGLEFDDTAVVASPDSGIESPADLAGRTISVPARGAQLEVTIADAVMKDGGDPSTIKWITLDFPSAVSSLESGRIDAAGLVSPFISQATEAGGTVVASPGVSFFGDGAIGLWVTSEAFAAESPDTVAAFQRAIAKANAYSNENVDEEQAAAAQVLKLDVESVKSGTKPYFPETVNPAALDLVIAKMTELGYLEKDVDADALMVTDS